MILLAPARDLLMVDRKPNLLAHDGKNSKLEKLMTEELTAVAV
jgi:hypothetical protein